MARDQAYYEAEKKTEPVNNHPRIFTTNSRMPANIRLFVTPFVDGVDLIFLRRVGGGYIFVHRLLMEHFAEMYVETPS